MIAVPVPGYLLLRQFTALSAVILALGTIYGALTAEAPLTGALEGLVYAGLIGIPLIFVETCGAQWPPFAATRRWPFWRMLIAKSALYSLWTALGGALAAELTHSPDVGPLFDLIIHRDRFATAALLAIAVNSFLAINRLVGPGVLLRFLGGRYHRPRRENRAFAFVDIRDSTPIAERIGDLRFHGYLNDACSIISRAALYSGGEVHDYVGDQVLVTWRADRPFRARGPFIFL